MMPETLGRLAFPVTFDCSPALLAIASKWAVVDRLEAWFLREIGWRNVHWRALHYPTSTTFYFLEEANALRFQLEMRDLVDQP